MHQVHQHLMYDWWNIKLEGDISRSENAYTRDGTGLLSNRVNKSSFTSGSPVIILTRCVRPEFFRFSKKYPKCKTYIWNAEMTKVIARCLLLDWNHWMSVHAMNFYFYQWLFKNSLAWEVRILLGDVNDVIARTPLHISRHLEFIIEKGHRVNWVSGSLDSRVTESLGHKMSGQHPSTHARTDGQPENIMPPAH